MKRLMLLLTVVSSALLAGCAGVPSRRGELHLTATAASADCRIGCLYVKGRRLLYRHSF